MCIFSGFIPTNKQTNKTKLEIFEAVVCMKVNCNVGMRGGFQILIG
jgi:hypothetical protein